MASFSTSQPQLMSCASHELRSLKKRPDFQWRLRTQCYWIRPLRSRWTSSRLLRIGIWHPSTSATPLHFKPLVSTSRRSASARVLPAGVQSSPKIADRTLPGVSVQVLDVSDGAGYFSATALTLNRLCDRICVARYDEPITKPEPRLRLVTDRLLVSL
jgi:hypothetical protein